MWSMLQDLPTKGSNSYPSLMRVAPNGFNSSAFLAHSAHGLRTQLGTGRRVGTRDKKPLAYMGTVHQAKSDLWGHPRDYEEGTNSI